MLLVTNVLEKVTGALIVASAAVSPKQVPLPAVPAPSARRQPLRAAIRLSRGAAGATHSGWPIRPPPTLDFSWRRMSGRL